MPSLQSASPLLLRKFSLLGVVAFVVVLWRHQQSAINDISSKVFLRNSHRSLNVFDPKTVRKKEQLTFLDQSRISEAMSSFEPLIDNSIQDPWKKTLFHRLDSIRLLSCGPLCHVNDRATFNKFAIEEDTTRSTFGVRLEIPGISCDAIMKDVDIDANDSTIPFPPPIELDKYYSMDGMIQYDPSYMKLKNIYLGGKQFTSNDWTVEMVDKYIENCKDLKKSVYDGYGTPTRHLLDWMRSHVDMKEKRILVVGSEVPWVEAISLHLGAAHVVTLEYGKINNLHPQISTTTPDEFRKLYLSGELGLFDVVVSYSSVEHSGLGRYGDALNPWGDLLAIAKVRCVTKESGYLVLAVPVGADYQDGIQFNAHRIYGKLRYPLLTANWLQIDAKDHLLQQGGGQPPFLFQKITIGMA